MKATWTSPSNIALVKYWGKYGIQLPKNPSISFTLKHSVTTLCLVAHPKKDAEGKNLDLDFFFEGKKNDKFKEKIAKFLLSEEKRFPWIHTHQLIVESKNTFPHSSGIASSASSMSALCLCLLSIDELITGKKMTEAEFFKAASELSRLASGSASRSVYPLMASWGETADLSDSSNLHATPFKDIHEIFRDFCDSILIVDEEEKSVSSRAGHGLMEEHPFKEQRFCLARENMSRLLIALKKGDLQSFIEVVEKEALMLHALMMTSDPAFILLKPNSLAIIDKIKKFRAEKNIPVSFTIDAGPNIHLLYPKKYQEKVRPWIEAELAPFLVGKKWIHDEVGLGPVRA